MERKNKRVLIISLIALILVVAGTTYAYFSARITGLESASTLSMTAGTLGIHYAEGNEEINMPNIYPKEEAWLTKTFTLTGNNTTELKMKYKVGLNIINNEFTSDALTYDLTHETVVNGTAIPTREGMHIKQGTNTKLYFGNGYFDTTGSDSATHSYTLKIYFKDNGKDQNVNQEKVFNAKIFVEEGSTIQGKSCYDPNLNEIKNYEIGEGCNTFVSAVASQTEYADYADTIATTVCSGETFEYGDMSFSLDDVVNYPESFNLTRNDLITNNVITNVEYGDIEDYANYSDGLYSYYYIQEKNGWYAELTDKESTSPVTEAPCTYINNKPINDMSGMFYESQATSLDLSSFDTSNVTNMTDMFNNSQATSLDLSSFDTSNVTHMGGMFSISAATSIDLNSFDTSNVTDMAGMFYYSQATTLDLSSFDTSEVTNMSVMFFNMPNLTTIYASNKFNTTAAVNNNVDSMFSASSNLVGGNGTAYNSSHVDAEYARIDGLNGLPGYFTAK